MIPFQPKKSNPLASHFNAMPIYSKILARMDKGHVPTNTTKTIIKIISIMFFIVNSPFMQEVWMQ